ncbi:DEAD/DEAH box helicase [Thiomicrorhabdus chilensis]|uniref:DEAD/DEAH box helicase n=1 Tax=Thiomicrorhabdus chilensis TaxID=63656 RepID=UPI00041F03FD|nr:DEAD/DEAH box helicase [Thiomicrorhabdus chilensis]
MTFEDFDLDGALLSAIEKQAYHKPTPIQAEAIPALLERQDVLAGAATGTGKTAAFVLPMLQYLLDEPKHPRHPRVMLLAPTRELAFQIHKVIKQLGSLCEFSSVIITGGFDQNKQIKNLKDPFDILVATPGRLTHLMAEGAVNLSEIEMVIIDEADRMLDMGQGKDVRALLDAIPGDFQAGLFSATLAGSGVRKFAEEILEDPVTIQIEAPNQKSEQIQQLVYLANDKAHKQALLENILNDASCNSAIVFCNKKERALEVADWLQSRNVSAQVLHGDFIQAVRLEKMQKFKSGKIKVLVATDVAARGLDLLNVTHVINYDMPFRGDIYIHRIGRTGRAQQVGLAINLVERHDIEHLQRIEYHLQQRLPVAKIKGLEARFTLKDVEKSKSKKKKKPGKKSAAKKKAKK